MKSVSEDLRAEAHLELVRRSLPGALAYAVLLLVVGFSTPYRVDHPWVLAVTAVILSVAGIWRVVLASRIQRQAAQFPFGGKREFRLGVVVCAFTWSAFAACTIAFYDAQWTSMIVLLMTAGIAAGGLTSLAPDLALSRVYISLMLAPAALIAALTTGGPALTVTIAIFAAFLFVESAHHHRDYWASALDRTELRAKAVELESAKKIADEATLAKSTLLANVSHEIRTPMNAILGMTDQLLESDLDAQRERWVKIVKESSETLLALINDILDLSKIEAGKLDLEEAPFNLRDAAHDVARALALRAHAQHLELTCRVSPAVPDQLVGDVVRLRQILTNLVGNAIKFTPRGGVAIEVVLDSGSDAKDAPAKPGEVVLHAFVSDSGVGIPDGKRQAIFDAFSQGDTSTTRQYGGTGLGLTISRTLVEMMGGRIWLDSIPGQGSTFHFTARFRTAAASARRVPGGALNGQSVLVVDDRPESRRVLAEIFQNWGMETVLVEDGQSALTALEPAARGHFDFIFLDAEMPDMDGFTVAEAISKDPRLPSPVMMLTSLAQRRDAERCKVLGITVQIVKPPSESDLYDAIVTAGKTRTSAAAAASEGKEHPVPESPAGKLRVLLVEDNPINQQIAIHMLTKRGYTVVVTSNGREGFEAFKSAGATPYDLVLMDIQMPEMDGLQATAAIRDFEQRAGAGRHTPIVAMTAHAMKGDRERCLAGGMDGYVSKPVRNRDLYRAIDDVLPNFAPSADLGMSGSHSATATLAPPAPAAPDARGPASGPPGPFEVANLAESLPDERSIQSLIRIFKGQYPEQIAELRAAIAASDAKALAAAAHTLKGSLLVMTADRAAAAASTLEDAARTGELKGTAAVLDALEAEVTAVSARLDAFSARLVVPPR